jgi:phage-related protein
MFKIVFFEKENGDEPARTFIDSLDNKMQAKILRLIEMLSQNGFALREPYSKHLDDGIFEIRAKSGSNITRVLYFFVMGKKIVLTNGFKKKQQKTPKFELDKAKKYRLEYMSSCKEKL